MKATAAKKIIAETAASDEINGVIPFGSAPFVPDRPCDGVECLGHTCVKHNCIYVCVNGKLYKKCGLVPSPIEV